jgi:hypothetical protein
MRRLFSVKSRRKSIVAAAVLSAAMLAFIRDASAEIKDTGTDTGTVKDVRVYQSILPSRNDVPPAVLLHGNDLR